MSKWRYEYNSRLTKLWPTQATEQFMADEFGVTTATVSVRAKRLGLPPRADRRNELRRSSHKHRFDLRVAIFSTIRKLDARTAEYLASCAEQRGWTMEQLLVTTLKIMACDKLLDAVLDDADQMKKTA